MADIDLPVWSIAPNWIEGVTERLSWMTDVTTSRSGVEQRVAVRLSPRRQFEFRINPVDQVRSYFDQWMHRISDERCLLPLWHDSNELAVRAEPGSTALFFDTAFTEFENGGLALLINDAFDFEVVTVSAVAGDRLNLSAPVDRAWSEATSVYPLRRAWMDPETRFSAITSRVGQATVAFMIDGPNDYPSAVEALPVHQGYPLVTLEPNRRDDLEMQFAREVEELDGSIGVIRRFDEVGRAFQTQFYNWLARGREQHHLLRQTLYRLQGRQKAFWLPSFNEDIVLARPVLAGEDRLSVDKIGYRLLGGPIPGRDKVFIRDASGATQVVSISGTSVGLDANEERLNLSAPSPFSAPAGTVGCFLSIMRLENDVVEIHHTTDSSGVCEVGVACKSFANTRSHDGPFIAPSFDAIKTDEPCGTTP